MEVQFQPEAGVWRIECSGASGVVDREVVTLDFLIWAAAAALGVRVTMSESIQPAN